MRPIQIPEQSEEQLKALEELYRTTRNVRLRTRVLHGSPVCIRQGAPFLTPSRCKVELIGWGPSSAVFPAWERSHPGGTAFGTTVHAAVHGAVHDTFMTLPAYTRTREGEGHELGPGVRSCFHCARSDPVSETRESIERE